ncbi:MAG TPA: histone-lysine N-methyltransferase, partial [Chloroflexota bacterium]|nr:histone-lysine N-methyltransferase [Chloroflexota bacterium]
ANAATAWLYGCAAVNTTLLGMGERCGNSPLEAALVEHLGLSEQSDGRQPDLSVLIELADYLRQECGVALPSNYPLLGEEAFTTRAGVHIDGLLKDPETYLSFDPQRVLGRPIGVVVSDRSGAAGIAWWVNAQLERAGQPRLDKSHPGVQAMYQALLARYAAGRTDDPSDQELLALARIHLPTLLP